MKKNIFIFSFFVALAALDRVSSLEFNLGNAYYGLLIAVFGVLLATGRGLKLNFFMTWLVAACLLSIYLNEIPTFFSPYERLIAFMAVMGLVGPFISNSTLLPFRKRLFTIVNALIVVMVVISFLGITAGLPMMLGRGGYAGLFNHSMMFGPMSAIAMLVAIHWAFQVQKLKVRWFYFTLAAIAFLGCVAAGSRSALVAAVAGGIFYYYKINQGKLTRFVRAAIVVVAIGIVSFPLWQPYTERIVGKMAFAEQQGDLLVTRAYLWQRRLREFNSSPIIGVGFAAVDTTISTKFDATNGRVEPGSSWLAVLSMVGLLGFIPLVLLIFRYFKFVFKDKADQLNSAFLGGLLSLFTVHMLAEGYVLSAGSGLFFYFWLLMGMFEQKSHVGASSLAGNAHG